ncbi:TonB-dependent receptor [Pseudooceanicola sediminis]|uniref:TonB-dependent receptor n=1 Tax=Pseudooceanicola sediminis TaxID=2211117 RepID=A0A399IXY9_9RHOB|nr:TonB-dependent receptor [Pseudooceanicola sediminis]RII37891.1 TonB-dependent receptor [Pseudooceanicola sediminis]|tara:strand:- start:30620 stop:32479 length:1860 start_codon:yes stop_codon:yes gene_type:complete
MNTPRLAVLRAATAMTTLALTGAVSQTAIAQDAIDLDAITVTANRGETTERSRTGSSVDVVTEEDLKSSGTTRLADYLISLPGISLSGNGGIGASTNLRIRGADGRYIGVYIDGIDVNDPASTQVSFDFGSLTTQGISRIEILKGAQSALYGSEAIAGVINITTNQATEPGLSQSIATEYGSYNTTKLAYNLSYLGARGSFATTLSHIRTDGFSTADENDGNTEADGHEATRLSFSGDYQLTDTVTVGGAAFWATSESEYDEYSGGPVDGLTHDETSEKDQLGLRAFARVDAGAVQHEFSAQYYQNDRLSSGTNSYGAFAYPYFGQRWSLGYHGQTELSVATLTFGADATRESYKNDGDSGANDMLGLWAQADWHLADEWELVTVLRHDDHSTFGGTTTGRVSLAWLPDPDLTLRAAVGTGFRAPSPYELYASYYGNPDLQPETSTSYELGIEKRLGAGSFNATLFRTEITDLIGYDRATYAYTQTEGTSWMQGLELSAKSQLSDRIAVSAAYTWTDSRDAKTGDRLARVPLHDIALRLNADLTPEISGALSVRHVAGLNDSTGSLPDYTTADVSVRYAISDESDVYLRIENLLDEQYQTARGYGTSDRAVYFGLRSSF